MYALNVLGLNFKFVKGIDRKQFEIPFVPF